MDTKQDWILECLTITQDWSKSGHYRGNVKFRNGVQMEVALILDNVKAAKMVALLSEEIVQSATKLSGLLINSMPVQIEAAKEETQVQ
jgi:chemotaxis protein CheY-P-specific phosphatase CheC